MPKRIRDTSSTTERAIERSMVRRAKRKPKAKSQDSRYWSLPLAGFPTSKIVRLRYVETVFMDASVIAPSVHAFSCNGMYDPNITGIGHQPRGFDQNMAFYDHYRVIMSKITVTPANNTISNLAPGAYDVLIQDDVASVVSTYIDLQEHHSSTGRLQRYGNEQGYIPGVQNSVTKVYKQKTFFRTGMNDPRFVGSVSTNPTEQAFFVLYAASMDDSTNPSIYNFNVVMEFIAELTEPKSIGVS